MVRGLFGEMLIGMTCFQNSHNYRWLIHTFSKTSVFTVKTTYFLYDIYNVFENVIHWASISRWIVWFLQCFGHTLGDTIQHTCFLRASRHRLRAGPNQNHSFFKTHSFYMLPEATFQNSQFLRQKNTQFQKESGVLLITRVPWLSWFWLVRLSGQRHHCKAQEGMTQWISWFWLLRLFLILSATLPHFSHKHYLMGFLNCSCEQRGKHK